MYFIHTVYMYKKYEKNDCIIMQKDVDWGVPFLHACIEILAAPRERM